MRIVKNECFANLNYANFNFPECVFQLFHERRIIFVAITRAEASYSLWVRANKTCFRDSLDYLASPAVYRALIRSVMFSAGSDAR